MLCVGVLEAHWVASKEPPAAVVHDDAVRLAFQSPALICVSQEMIAADFLSEAFRRRPKPRSARPALQLDDVADLAKVVLAPVRHEVPDVLGRFTQCRLLFLQLRNVAWILALAIGVSRFGQTGLNSSSALFLADPLHTTASRSAHWRR